MMSVTRFLQITKIAATEIKKDVGSYLSAKVNGIVTNPLRSLSSGLISTAHTVIQVPASLLSPVISTISKYTSISKSTLFFMGSLGGMCYFESNVLLGVSIATGLLNYTKPGQAIASYPGLKWKEARDALIQEKTQALEAGWQEAVLQARTDSKIDPLIPFLNFNPKLLNDNPASLPTPPLYAVLPKTKAETEAFLNNISSYQNRLEIVKLWLENVDNIPQEALDVLKTHVPNLLNQNLAALTIPVLCRVLPTTQEDTEAFLDKIFTQNCLQIVQLWLENVDNIPQEALDVLKTHVPNLLNKNPAALTIPVLCRVLPTTKEDTEGFLRAISDQNRLQIVQIWLEHGDNIPQEALDVLKTHVPNLLNQNPAALTIPVLCRVLPTTKEDTETFLRAISDQNRSQVVQLWLKNVGNIDQTVFDVLKMHILLPSIPFFQLVALGDMNNPEEKTECINRFLEATAALKEQAATQIPSRNADFAQELLKTIIDEQPAILSPVLLDTLLTVIVSGDQRMEIGQYLLENGPWPKELLMVLAEKQPFLIPDIVQKGATILIQTAQWDNLLIACCEISGDEALRTILPYLQTLTTPNAELLDTCMDAIFKFTPHDPLFEDGNKMLWVLAHTANPQARLGQLHNDLKSSIDFFTAYIKQLIQNLPQEQQHKAVQTALAIAALDKKRDAHFFNRLYQIIKNEKNAHPNKWQETLLACADQTYVKTTLGISRLTGFSDSLAPFTQTDKPAPRTSRDNRGLDADLL